MCLFRKEQRRCYNKAGGLAMRSFGITFMYIIIILILYGCGDEETLQETSLPSESESDVTGEEKDESFKPVEPQQPIEQTINNILDKLIKGIEKEELDLYLEIFWEDIYFYHSDSATDDLADDIVFENIELEKDSAQRLFESYDDFVIEFGTEDIKKIDETIYEVKNSYELVASVALGKILPGGYQKVFAKGNNTFIFKKRADWRISRWEQEEMTPEEIEAAKAKIFPPGGALIQTWGMLKLR